MSDWYDVDEPMNVEALSRFGLGVRDKNSPHHWREDDGSLSFSGDKKTILILPGSGTHDSKAANGMCKIVENILPPDKIDEFQICSMYYDNGLTSAAPTVIRAQQVFDRFVAPLVSTKDENGDLHRISAMRAAHQLRRLTVVTHCYGSDIQNAMDNQLGKLMLDLGYLGDERKFIHRQLVVAQHNNIDANMGERSFLSTNLIRLSTADEEMPRRETFEGSFRHYIHQNAPDTNEALCVDLSENAQVFLVFRIGYAASKEHNGAYWRARETKSVAGQKEEDIFKAVFAEAVCSDKLIENSKQFIQEAISKDPEKQALMTEIVDKGHRYGEAYRTKRKEVLERFEENKKALAEGRLNTADLSEADLMFEDNDGRFLLDEAVSKNQTETARQIFDAMTPHLPVMKRFGWEKWPWSKNQEDAFYRTHVWAQQSLNNGNHELFNLFVQKDAAFDKLVFDKADEQMLLTVAQMYQTKDFPQALDKQNAYARGMAAFYAQTEKMPKTDTIAQAQKIIEDKMFVPKGFSGPTPTSYMIDRLESHSAEFGAEKLREKIKDYRERKSALSVVPKDKGGR